MVDIVYVDWSMNRGVVGVFDDLPHTAFGHWPDLVAMVDEVLPATVILEATFESFSLAKRKGFLHYCADRGIAVGVVPARGNTFRRRAAEFEPMTYNRGGIIMPAWGLAKDNSLEHDAENAHGIRVACQAGKSVRWITSENLQPAQEWIDRFAEANKMAMLIRASGRTEDYVQRLEAQLPLISELSLDTQLIFQRTASKKRYNLTAMRSVAVAAAFTNNRAEFDKLTGLHAHGYPCLIRADLQHFTWKSAERKNFKYGDFRRTVRQMGSILKQIELRPFGIEDLL